MKATVPVNCFSGLSLKLLQTENKYKKNERGQNAASLEYMVPVTCFQTRRYIALESEGQWKAIVDDITILSDLQQARRELMQSTQCALPVLLRLCEARGFATRDCHEHLF